MAKGKWEEEPQLFLELLLWITQVIDQHVGANPTNGIKYEAYQQLTTTD